MTADNPDAVGRAWLAAMRRGDWAAAWEATDRLELPRRAAQRTPGFERAPHHLVWDGSDFAGRSVLVRCEHGLGDTLQSLRFLPAIAACARELHVMAQPPLLPLLRGKPGLGQVHDGWAGPDWPAHELEIEVTELAYAARATPATVPPPYPHLADGLPAFALPRSGRLQVGLLWAASEWDSSRSLTPQHLAPLLALPQLRFHGLQQGPANEDPQLRDLPIEPLWRRTQAVADCAAAIRALDLVVCVDGMPAHLAGHLGVPTWMLLKHDADWRWGDSGSRTPWYPRMRLFRQPGPADWAGAVAALCEALVALPTAPHGLHLPAPGGPAPIIGAHG